MIKTPPLFFFIYCLIRRIVRDPFDDQIYVVHCLEE